MDTGSKRTKPKKKTQNVITGQKLLKAKDLLESKQKKEQGFESKKDTKVISKRSGPPGRSGRNQKRRHKSHILNEVDHRVSGRNQKKTQKSYPKRSGPPGLSGRNQKKTQKSVVVTAVKNFFKGKKSTGETEKRTDLQKQKRHKSHTLNMDHRAKRTKQKKKTQKSYPKRSGPPGRSGRNQKETQKSYLMK